MVGVQRGEMFEGLVPGHLVVALADAPTARDVVEPQGGGIRPRHRLGNHPVAAEEWDEEGQRRDEVGRVVQQPLALGQVLVHEANLALLEVAEAAVHHLGGLRRRTRGEVVLLDQRGLQAAARGVERHTGPGDAAADHQHVELLVRQAAQRVGTAKGVHEPSLPQPAAGPIRPAKRGIQLPSGVAAAAQDHGQWGSVSAGRTRDCELSGSGCGANAGAVHDRVGGAVSA